MLVSLRVKWYDRFDRMKFKTVEPERRGQTSEGVVMHLRGMIHRGIAFGRPPPERDLAKLLGVSRPTLRAGIRSLAPSACSNRARGRHAL
jgi:DNA-binding FadR family transcriptional regulator